MVSIILALFVAFDTVNRPDAMMYHLPFSKILNEEKIILGLSNLHFRFSHTSILQYSSSINNNFLIGNNGIIIPLASIYIFLLLYFFNELNISLKEKNFSLSKFFLFAIIILITYKINRYSKIGNDDIGHLVGFLIIYKFFDYKKIYLNNFKEISLLSIFVLANKFSLILFCLIPLIIIIENKKLIKKIFTSISFYFLLIWCIKNIFISGCFLYPLEQTCINKLNWVEVESVKKQNLSGEAWAKDWVNYNQKETGMEYYIRNFNWLETWSSNHLKKIVKNIAPLIIILTIIVIFNFDKKNFQNQKKYLKKRFLKVFIISILGVLIFILKFPLYRYGYSYLAVFTTLCFIPMINFENNKKIGNLYKFFIIFCIVILFSKQFTRHYKYYDKRPIIPQYVSNNIELKKIYLDKNFNYYLNEKNQNCWYNQSLCTFYKLENIKFDNILNYKMLSIKKDHN